jgi:hydroxyquinol 1,2-dioxygenase
MRDFDENNITAAVIARFQNTPDARLKEIMISLVRHLHDFARDVRLSFEEWSYVIDLLTRTGQTCSSGPAHQSCNARPPDRSSEDCKNA